MVPVRKQAITAVDLDMARKPVITAVDLDPVRKQAITAVDLDMVRKLTIAAGLAVPRRIGRDLREAPRQEGPARNAVHRRDVVARGLDHR